MIILDIEWNTGYAPHSLPEILQIGAVRYDRSAGRITDTFCCFIKPSVNQKIGYFAKSLPCIEDSEKSAESFPSGYADFLRWCGNDGDYGVWGVEDFSVIQENCAHYGLDVFLPENIYDLQIGFSLLAQTDRRVSLSDAVEYCGIPSPFDFHDALYDSVYTSVICSYLSDSVMRDVMIPGNMYRYTVDPVRYERQPRRSLGPFKSLNAGLNNRSSRQIPCPVCGWVRNVNIWHCYEDSIYYSMISCPRHGYFPCRIYLSRKNDGRWYGRLSVQAIVPESIEAFQFALKGRKFVCSELPESPPPPEPVKDPEIAVKRASGRPPRYMRRRSGRGNVPGKPCSAKKSPGKGVPEQQQS